MSQTKKKRLIHHHERTASSLLEALSPTSGLIAAWGDPRDFIYRGCASTEYRLIASAFRGKGVSYPDSRVVSERRTFRAQIFAEQQWLSSFCDVADQRGLRIPEDSRRFRALLERAGDDDEITRAAKGETAWPPDELLSALALAQHYGIPTRLLDFTASPYVAAYFAATSALHDRVAGRAAIWAFAAGKFFLFNNFDWLRERVRVVSAPGADIPNLQAQQGRFLVVLEKDFRPSAQFPDRSYGELLISQLSLVYEGPIIYRFTYPVAQSGELLRQLSLIGVDGSTMFPGHGGAALAVRERLLWPAPGSRSEQRAVLFARKRLGPKWKKLA